MIKDAGLASSLLRSFPDITKADEQQIFEMLPHYIFYKTVDKHTKECTCTHCKKTFKITDKRNKVIFSAKHKDEIKCPKCKRDVQYRSYGMGRKCLEGWDKVAIMHAKDQDLFIRCFYVDWNFKNSKADFRLNERHRYYAGECGAHHWEKRNLWYGASGWEKNWTSMTCENEPVFGSCFGGNYDMNEYTVLNPDEWKKTCLKYCQFDVYKEQEGNFRPIAYLCFAAKHPNVEYVIKTGYVKLIRGYLSGWTSPRINWRSNDIKKMLGLNKEEMKIPILKNDYETYCNYKIMKKLAPGESIDITLRYASVYGRSLDTIKTIQSLTGLSFKKVVNYADRNRGNYILMDWRDYLQQCQKLGYNLSDTAVSKPKDLAVAHTRTSKILNDLQEIERQKEERKRAIQQKEKMDGYAEKMKKRYKELQKLKFVAENLGLKIVVPKEYIDIVNEGKILNHCVGGYADRHAEGKLNILFVRTIAEPDLPYYTMEVDTKGSIIQCRGYKNNNAGNPKPPEVEEFEKQYAEHLQKCFSKTKKNNKPKKQTVAAPAA